MKFRTRPADDAPDINFIPLIDVLLVIVIFLAVSTTFSKERVIDVLLPQAQTQTEISKSIEITLSADGQVAIGQRVLMEVTVEALTAAIVAVAGSDLEQVVVIRADANATHQSVVNAMQAVRLAGIRKLSLAAQVAN
jgi:biopolymer transport protein ExbD